MELIDRVHAHMKDLLAKEGANIDGIFFCPHYPRGNVPEYSVECDCRKPRTGLVQKACEEFDIDMKNSYVIGDRCSDIELAERSNLQGIMVTTGYGLGDIEYVLPNKPFKPLHIARDFLHAVRWIIEREEKS